MSLPDHVKELRGLEAEWQDVRRGELARLNERARALELPAIILPRREEVK